MENLQLGIYCASTQALYYYFWVVFLCNVYTETKLLHSQKLISAHPNPPKHT